MHPRARRLPPPPLGSSNPGTTSPAGCAAAPVWALPRSLAATEGLFSLPRGTEMFQFPRFPPSSTLGPGPCARGVAPFGNPWISGCQRLPRALRRVAASFLGRLRLGILHALFSAESLTPTHRIRVSAAKRQRRTGTRQQGRSPLTPHRTVAIASALSRPGWPDSSARQTSRVERFRPSVRPTIRFAGQNFNRSLLRAVRAGERARVPPRPHLALGGDARLTRGRRTQRVPRGALSKCGWESEEGVGAPGLEPGTSALSGPRSNRLSYAPGAMPSRRPKVTRASARCPISSRKGDIVALCPRRSARSNPQTDCHNTTCNTAMRREPGATGFPGDPGASAGRSTSRGREHPEARCPKSTSSDEGEPSPRPGA
jgi:hypothetical protein